MSQAARKYATNFTNEQHNSIKLYTDLMVERAEKILADAIDRQKKYEDEVAKINELRVEGQRAIMKARRDVRQARESRDETYAVLGETVNESINTRLIQ